MLVENEHRASQASGETVYTCPMHPEVQSAEPGNCPKCGMVLTPKSETGDAGHKHEASDEASGGCCGGSSHKHDDKAAGGGCCGGHKHEHAHQ